eukprot:TRINITY_DN1823_c0_g1_i1.p1 TRINITY_DN1823_c0_g1~~TRINITY_DN1823_c0_g1_i1.p1  ORF type:complete len:312 (-),score=93.93 TRINITY_DN1823_c0_g1_i1:115-1050(-)
MTHNQTTLNMEDDVEGKQIKPDKKKCKKCKRMSGEIELLKASIKKLEKEKSFLLDRLLMHEVLSSDSEGEEQNSEVSEAERPAKRFKKEEAPKVAAPQHQTLPAPAPPVPAPAPAKKSIKLAVKKAPVVPQVEEELQMCQALGKDGVKPCKSKALSGFRYCWHHAPLDPSTGFIFCQYVNRNKKNPKKCTIPVDKTNSEPYCNYHVKRSQRLSNKSAPATTAGKSPHPVTAGKAPPSSSQAALAAQAAAAAAAAAAQANSHQTHGDEDNGDWSDEGDEDEYGEEGEDSPLSTNHLMWSNGSNGSHVHPAYQ